MIIQQEEECIELNKRSHRRPPRQVKIEKPRLFCSFIFWATLSFIASVIIFTGFWLPYWVRGAYHDVIDVSFGPFRRCNYPMIDEHGQIQIIPECGRYKSFSDIPSLSWKITSILVTFGLALSLLVSFTLMFTCCMPYSLTPGNSRTLVFLQLFSMMLVISGCAIYPLGWSNQEFRDACGANTTEYQIGSCHLSLSAYLIAIGLILELICLLLGLLSIRKLSHQTLKSYNNSLQNVER